VVFFGFFNADGRRGKKYENTVIHIYAKGNRKGIQLILCQRRSTTTPPASMNSMLTASLNTEP